MSRGTRQGGPARPLSSFTTMVLQGRHGEDGPPDLSDRLSEHVGRYGLRRDAFRFRTGAAPRDGFRDLVTVPQLPGRLDGIAAATDRMPSICFSIPHMRNAWVRMRG